MNISVKEFRTQPSRVLSLVKSGTDITITLRGKPTAKLIPIEEPQRAIGDDDFYIGFGMWKNRENATSSVDVVEKMRRGRQI
jgi:prevent-host-death family protein